MDAATQLDEANSNITTEHNSLENGGADISKLHEQCVTGENKLQSTEPKSISGEQHLGIVKGKEKSDTRIDIIRARRKSLEQHKTQVEALNRRGRGSQLVRTRTEVSCDDELVRSCESYHLAAGTSDGGVVVVETKTDAVEAQVETKTDAVEAQDRLTKPHVTMHQRYHVRATAWQLRYK